MKKPASSSFPLAPHPGQKQLTDAMLELIASRFRALAEPLRLKMLNTMMQGERTVSQLVESCGSGQANISKHLALLKEAGMVATRRQGLHTFCSIADPVIFQLCELMCAKLKTEHEQRSREIEKL